MTTRIPIAAALLAMGAGIGTASADEARTVPAVGAKLTYRLVSTTTTPAKTVSIGQVYTYIVTKSDGTTAEGVIKPNALILECEGNDALLFLGIPLSTAILMKFSPMGPFMTELYPTELRGTGQGFCYNGGRAIGSFFPTMVGFTAAYMPLGSAIVLFCVLASGLMIVMLLMLPETRGRGLAVAEATAS